MEKRFKLSIHLFGIKKRCRKVERHTFRIGYLPYNDGTYSEAEIMDNVRAFISENMKEIRSGVSISLDYVEVVDEIMTWMPFDKRSVSFNLKTQLEQELQ